MPTIIRGPGGASAERPDVPSEGDANQQPNRNAPNAGQPNAGGPRGGDGNRARRPHREENGPGDVPTTRTGESEQEQQESREAGEQPRDPEGNRNTANAGQLRGPGQLQPQEEPGRSGALSDLGYTPPGPGFSITITPRTIWLAVGIVGFSLLMWLVVTTSAYVIILLFIAVIIAEALRPIVVWLHTRWHFKPWIAVLSIYLLILVILAFLIYLFIHPFLGQLADFANHLPLYEKKIANMIAGIRRFLGNNPQIANALNILQAQAGTIFSALGPLLVKIPFLVGQWVLGAIVVIVMTFFWLTGIETLKPFIVGMFPHSTQEEVTDILTEMALRLGGYVRGVVVNMFVIGILAGVGDWLLGAPYPILLGILAGLTELIPYFGPWISGGAALFVTLIIVGPTKAAEVIGFYIVMQEFEGHTLIPYVMMRTVDLNPLTIIIAVLVGGELGGIMGSILAVPAAAIIHILLVRVVAPVARHAAARVTVSDDNANLGPLVQATRDGGGGGGPGRLPSGPPPLPA